MDMYLLVCPHCGQKMKVPGSYFGKTVKCVSCEGPVEITVGNTRRLPGKPIQPQRPPAKPAPPAKKRIGEELVEAGLVTEANVAEALKAQKERGGKTVEILVEQGHLDTKTFAEFLAQREGVASIDLTRYEVSDSLTTLVPAEFAREHQVFPIDRLGSLLTIGMACPLDTKTIEQLEAMTDLRVKAFLCSMEDINRLVKTYYGGNGAEETGAAPPADADDSVLRLEVAVKLENVASLIRQIDALPALSDTIQRLQHAMQDDDVSSVTIAEIISSDPSLTAKLLSVANSAAYGLPNRVTSVVLATNLLGVRETYRMALSCAVLDKFDKNRRFDCERFWMDSMYCAQNARAIAKRLHIEDHAGMFAAGLLHGIGRVALWEAVPERYAKIDPSLVGPALVAAEEDVLGLAHPEAGYLLASNWRLPYDIAEPIRFHHAFEHAAEHRDATAVVAVAAACTEYWQHGQFDQQSMRDACGAALDYLGLDFQVVTAILGNIYLESAPKART